MSARVSRYARVGANVGGVAARIAGARLFGMEGADQSNAAALTKALGGLKGPMMKVAQLMATIPDVLPPEYAEELSKLQSEAPPMGPAFVKRRMMAELGPDWQNALRLLRAALLRRRLARPGAPRHRQGRQPAGLQAAISGHAVRRGGRSRPARDPVRPASAHGPRHRHARDLQGDRCAGARGARLPAGGQARRALYATCSRQGARWFASPAIWPELSTAPPAHLDWLEGEKLLTFKQHRSRSATASRPPCSRRGGCPSAASA